MVIYIQEYSYMNIHEYTWYTYKNIHDIHTRICGDIQEYSHILVHPPTPPSCSPLCSIFCCIPIFLSNMQGMWWYPCFLPDTGSLFSLLLSLLVLLEASQIYSPFKNYNPLFYLSMVFLLSILVISAIAFIFFFFFCLVWTYFVSLFLDSWGKSFNYWFNYLIFFLTLAFLVSICWAMLTNLFCCIFIFTPFNGLFDIPQTFTLTYRSSRYVLLRVHVFGYFCVIYNDRFLCFHGNWTIYFTWFYFVFTFVKVCSMVENMVYLGTCFIHV